MFGERGMSLLEVMIAMVLLAVGLLGMDAGPRDWSCLAILQQFLFCHEGQQPAGLRYPLSKPAGLLVFFFRKRL